MEYKLFKDEPLYFVETIPYVGPITLAYYPMYTILHLFDKYIVNMKNGYYEVVKVKYLDTIYSIEDFIEKYPEVLKI